VKWKVCCMYFSW